MCLFPKVRRTLLRVTATIHSQEKASFIKNRSLLGRPVAANIRRAQPALRVAIFKKRIPEITTPQSLRRYPDHIDNLLAFLISSR